MECILAKIADMSTEIEREIDELVDLKHEIAEAIYLVDNPELRALLELRYACFKPWSAIAEKLGYSERRVYELHGAALKKIVI
jgi:DNA-directed RNA polymerase specialized sigma subunit